MRSQSPYADRLSAAMPKDRPEARRAYSHLLNMIRASALLHQRQRASGPVEHGDTIQADTTDYVIAAHLLRAPLGRALGRDLSRATANAVRRWEAIFADECFDSTNILERDPSSSCRRTVQRYLREAADHGLVQQQTERSGSKPATWRILDTPGEAGATWLPTVDELQTRDGKKE